MKNKPLIILISIVSIFLIVLLGIRYNFSSNMSKIKADITYPTTNGLAYSCESTEIVVGQSTTCTLVGHYTGGVSGVSDALVSVSSGLEIVSVNVDTNEYDRHGSGNTINVLALDETTGHTGENFIVATVIIKGVEAGSNTLSLLGTCEPGSNHEANLIDIIDSSDSDNFVDSISQAINVTSSSSGGGEEGGDVEESSINTLESVSLSDGTMSPATFDRTVKRYNVTLPNEVSEITIDGEVTDPKSTVDGFGTYGLESGEELEIPITVTAEDGSISEYLFIVTRQAAVDPTKSSDNNLKGLTLKDVTISPEFSASVTSYTATVENTVTKVEVTATTNDDKATVLVTGNNDLKEGANTISIKVTAENNQIKTYTVVVTRKPAGGSTTCTLELTSTAYKIDNAKQTIDLVNKDDTDATIRKNISAQCGSISVAGDKVILSDGGNVKTYTINRVFVPKTGQNPIMYVAVILGIGLVIGVLIFLKKKMNK